MKTQKATENVSAQVPVEAPGQYQDAIAIELVKPSATNPRKYFDEGKLAELAASIKAKGVIVPLVTRAVNGHYEIVAGERRWRASKLAGLATVPVVVRELTDVQVLEIQLIENLQREDVHPLEEADGFALLLKQPNYTVEVLAEKIGHQPAYVYKRLQLAKLIDKAKDAFRTDRINLGHATALARLPQDKQKVAFDNYLFDKEPKWIHGKWVKDESALSVADFNAAIREHLLLDLSTAPWKKDDAKLDPKAGACTVCTKRSGANAALFDDMRKGDMCLDGKCFEGKRDAHLVQIQVKSKEAGKPLVRVSSNYLGSPEQKKKADALSNNDYRDIDETDKRDKKCDCMEDAIVVDGQERGKQIKICRDRTCKIHFGGGSFSSGGSDKPKDFWEERGAALPKKIEWATRRAILRAVVAVPNIGLPTPPKRIALKWTIPQDQLRVIAHSLLGNNVPEELIEAFGFPHATSQIKNGSDAKKHLQEVIDSPEKSPNGSYLANIVMGLSLQETAKEYCWKEGDDAKRLIAAADALQIDHKKIAANTEKNIRDDFNNRRAKAKARKAEADKKDQAKAKPAPAAKPAAKPAKKK